MNEKQKNISSKIIKSFIKELEYLKDVLKLAMEAGMDWNDEKLYSSYLKDVYDNLQKTCLKFRNFASNEILNPSEIEKMFDKEIENSEIEITKFDNNVIKISMPIITPFVIYKKKKLYSRNALNSREIEAIDRSDFIINTLERAIVKFFKDNKIDCNAYKNKTLVYINYFENSYQRRLIPDTDNYSYKAFTDLITGYFTSNGDSAFETDFFIKTTHGDKTHTEIYLVPAHFNSFIKDIISPNAIYDKSA